jgi:hypothetical protein
MKKLILNSNVLVAAYFASASYVAAQLVTLY